MDIKFDYRLDSKCGDPDADSKSLYSAHIALWNKELPNGKNFDLSIAGNSRKILLKNQLTDNLSSDRMCPSFVGKYNGKFDKWLSKNELNQFQFIVRTIGGHIVFPAHKKNGHTINQSRGFNHKIHDRFDLTLECIRRFYCNENSPLYPTLVRYSDFFQNFVDFEGFINFFLLHDFVDQNYSILFAIPFDNFSRNALPISPIEYRNYASQTIASINNRNLRISNFITKTAT